MFSSNITKKLFFFIVCLSTIHSYGQITIYNNLNKLDSLTLTYQVLTTDNFPGTDQEYYPEYSKILKGIGKHLSENDFYWEEERKIYCHFYFSTKGEADVFIYKLLRFYLSPEKEARFNILLSSYFAKHNIILEKESSTAFSMG